MTDRDPLETRALVALYRNHPDTSPNERYRWDSRRRARALRGTLLSWAATLPDYRLLDCRNLGKTSLAWIRANEPTGYMAAVTDGTGYVPGMVYGTGGNVLAPEPIYIDRLREAVDLALFDAEEGHTHPACRATFRRVAMAAFDAEAASILTPEATAPHHGEPDSLVPDKSRATPPGSPADPEATAPDPDR